MPVATLEMHETKTVGKFEQMVTDPAGCGEYNRTFGSRQCLPSDRTWLLQKALAEEGYGSDTVRALMIGDECPIRLKQALQVLASVARNRRCRYKNLYLSWALRLTPLVVSLKHQVRTWTRHPCLKPPCSKIGDEKERLDLDKESSWIESASSKRSKGKTVICPALFD